MTARWIAFATPLAFGMIVTGCGGGGGTGGGNGGGGPGGGGPLADTTPPTITATVTPSANANGWHNSPVTVSFDCVDVGSGIAACPDDIVVDSETAGLAVSGTATDNAGNTADVSVMIMLDLSSPAITIGSPLGNSPVPTTYIEGAIAEPLSGLEMVTCANDTAVFNNDFFECFSPAVEGSNVIVVSAIDLAGNASSVDVPLLLDRTPPAIVIQRPVDGALVSTDSVNVEAILTDDVELVSAKLNGVAVSIDTNGRLLETVRVREGSNSFVISAVDSAFNAVSLSSTVFRDTIPPVVDVVWPRNNEVITMPAISLIGTVNDIVPGTVNGNDCTVTVNGIIASVSNGTFVAESIPLIIGNNAVNLVATDAAGNTASKSINIVRSDPAGLRLTALGGDRQTGAAGQTLAEPIVVRLIDEAGNGVMDRLVQFNVQRGDGKLIDSQGAETRSLVVRSDANGDAAVRFRLGTRSGSGGDLVAVSATGVTFPAAFSFTVTPGVATRLRIVSGSNQVAAEGSGLLDPLVVVATDDQGNPVPGTRVLFEIGGRGRIDSLTSVERTTDFDGRASVVYNIGFGGEDIAGSVIAQLPDAPDPDASTVLFAAWPLAAGAGATSLVGSVLSGYGEPLINATVGVAGVPVVRTNSEGAFRLDGVAPGQRFLIVDGSSAINAGTWPRLEFDTQVVAGRENVFHIPIRLPLLDTVGAQLAGGASDVTLEMANVPGMRLTILANSLTCPGGASECVVSFSQVPRDKVPMPPLEGSSPGVVWTIQPSGAIFDPPARLEMPNIDQLPPGQVVDFFSFDHGLMEFVRMATGSVSDDGASIVTDPGMGIRIAGWGHPMPPAVDPGCGADEFTRADFWEAITDDVPDEDLAQESEVPVCVKERDPTEPCKRQASDDRRKKWRTRVGLTWAFITGGRGTGRSRCPADRSAVGVRG